jgi:histidine ammonia-lyase
LSVAPHTHLPLRELGEVPLTLDELLAIGRGELRVSLGASGRERVRRGADLLAAALSSEAPIYGVTTGVGDSVTTAIAASMADRFPLNLLRFHGCGVGPKLTGTEAATVVAVRLASLSRGYGGVREVVVDRLCQLLALRLLPRIPGLGSVGASGDLTPLSYLAALLVGEREATLRGELMSAAEAHAAVGLEPLTLLPKESLAIMNGTSVLTALGCLAWERARYLARLVAAITAGLSDVVRGNAEHFSARIFELKPHPGLVKAAAWIREDIELEARKQTSLGRLQDRYSIRCAPHVIGVLVDAVAQLEQTLFIEANSINDNPILDPDTGSILHGGNFYAGHAGFALDALKVAVANVADLLDRQLVLLCDGSVNGGLPTNLVAAPFPESTIHHGFKAVSIAASALTAEALKLTVPASIFSRSAEAHNQDKVPMASIAARDSLAILDLTENVAAMALLAVCQGYDLRAGEHCHGRLTALWRTIREHIPMVEADRPMDGDLELVVALIRDRRLPVGDL